MRDIRVTEVDIGCVACEAIRKAKDNEMLFFIGVSCGLLNNDMRFCTSHLATFQAIASPSSSDSRPHDAKEKG